MHTIKVEAVKLNTNESNLSESNFELSQKDVQNIFEYHLFPALTKRVAENMTCDKVDPSLIEKIQVMKYENVKHELKTKNSSCSLI